MTSAMRRQAICHALAAVATFFPLNLRSETPPLQLATQGTFNVPEEFTALLGDYRSSFPRLTGFEYSGLHWENFIVIYANTGDQVYLENFSQYIDWYEDPDDEDNMPEYKTYPVGTVIVKENFASNQGKPAEALSVTMMLKKAPGYDDEHGNWQYVQFNAAGKTLVNGNSQDPATHASCVDCHVNVADRDHVFSHTFSAQP